MTQSITKIIFIKKIAIYKFLRVPARIKLLCVLWLETPLKTILCQKKFGRYWGRFQSILGQNLVKIKVLNQGSITYVGAIGFSQKFPKAKAKAKLVFKKLLKLKPALALALGRFTLRRALDFRVSKQKIIFKVIFLRKQYFF